MRSPLCWRLMLLYTVIFVHLLGSNDLITRLLLTLHCDHSQLKKVEASFVADTDGLD